MLTAELFWGTAIAAFFGSLAAAAIAFYGQWLASRARARSEVLDAIAAHIRRLWDYQLAYRKSQLDGAANGATNKGQFAPVKPPIDDVLVVIEKARGPFLFTGRARLDKLYERVRISGMDQSDGKSIGGWDVEAQQLRKLARSYARGESLGTTESNGASGA
ncbi:hypothetical protein SCB71_14350 [Herbiconiux sp. KACC 21604]|uniref:hypothetical protein n=1 Tax=unclassified Herbiconiux TaxID=2618217 RepID=UPI001491D45E|nr:hypothetical protein [Herbiconiux sp. SALV-R1]QJU54323.1 hypothetical protein HL652_12290 [Herbiconiux sp. SALV-R1]WPO85393.1 hypothetical protein SCB71_14350 [Herbiconiux sp. KACC 21604]